MVSRFVPNDLNLLGSDEQRYALEEDKWVHTACSMCTTCPIKVRIKNGSIVDVVGEDIPVMSGKVCGKALAGLIDRVYHPNRILHPLKRVGGRGEGKFVRCGWTEVIDAVAEKFKKYTEEGHPEWLEIWWSCPVQTDNPHFIGYWCRVTGASLCYVHGQNCFGDRAVEATITFGKNHYFTEIGVVIDWANTKYAVISAMNFPACGSGNTSFGAGGNSTPITAKLIGRAKENGLRMILVDPKLTDSGAACDEWIPIKPGTDAIFVFGIARIIIHEKLYDEEFLLKYTNAPQLIRVDNGLPLKDKDGNYLVWDVKINSVKPIPNAGELEGLTLGSGRTFKVVLNGEVIECKTAFQLFTEIVSKYPSQKVVNLCEIPYGPEKVEEIAKNLGKFKPSAILTCGFTAGRYPNWFQVMRGYSVVNMLLGNFDKPGGWYFLKNDIGISTMGVGWPKELPPAPDYWGDPPASGPWGTLRPRLGVDSRDVYTVPPKFHYAIQSLPWFHIDSILKGEIRLLVTTAENPGYYLTNMCRNEEAFRKLDLLLVGDQVQKDSMDWADYVIPEASYLERDMLYSGTFPGLDNKQETIVFSRTPVTKPLGESKPLIEVLIEVAKNVGNKVWQYFKFTENPEWRSMWHDRRLKKAGLPVSFKDLEEKGPYVITRSMIFDPTYAPIATPSGRFELYSNELAEVIYYNPRSVWHKRKEVYPLPVYVPIVEPNERDQFYLTQGKAAWHQRNATQDNPILMEDSIEGYCQLQKIYINAQRAQELGINDEDWVVVESVGPNKKDDPNVHSEIKEKIKDVVRAKVVEGVHPKCCWVYFGAGHRSKYIMSKAREGLNANYFIPDNIEPYAGGVGKNYAIVKIRKATPPEVKMKMDYIKTGDRSIFERLILTRAS